jgi:hypothetical protein
MPGCRSALEFTQERQTLGGSHLEGRHPGLTWYTTSQFKHARGFYDRYRRDSNSP